MFDTLISERILEMTFKPAREVGVWLERIGMEVDMQDDGTVILHNPYLNFTTAIYDSLDPVSRAVVIASTLMGVAWPQICPGMLEQVNREWKRRHQTISKGEGKDIPKPQPKKGPYPHHSFEMMYRQENDHTNEGTRQ